MERKEFKLSQIQIKELNELEKDIKWLDQQITKAQRAGFDVTEMRKNHQRLANLRVGILKEYS